MILLSLVNPVTTLDEHGFQLGDGVTLIRSLFSQARNFRAYEESEHFLARVVPAAVIMLCTAFT
jgi:hypothetical protein